LPDHRLGEKRKTLKRFGDYEELADGTLMRMEGNKEFRIYCEDSGWLLDSNDGRGVILTEGLQRVIQQAARQADKAREKARREPTEELS
jgi:hypothetical protein